MPPGHITLKGGDRGSSRSDSIAAQMGRGPVGGSSVDHQLKIIAGSHAGTRFHADERGGQAAPDMYAESGIHPIQATLGDEIFRSMGGFLCGLEQQSDRTWQFFPVLQQKFCRSQQHGGMAVVAAGMHGAVLSGIGQAGVLPNGKGINVSPEQNGFPRE